MNKKLIVSPAPHITGTNTTNVMMISMLVALMPTAIAGVINYGVRALYMIIISVVSAYLFELLFVYLKERRFVFVEYSSIVTGLITALILPVNAPLYYPLLASFLAVVVFKGCFGGIGRNILNPSAAARVTLGLLFSGLTLSLFVGAGPIENAGSPLSYFMMGDYSSITLRSLFVGSAPGAIGTASIICIIATGIMLMIFNITDFTIVVGSLITFIATVWVGKGSIAIVPYLFSGSFLFATFFMIPDPTTSPLTVWGKLIYGLLFGFVAGLFRVNFVMGETSVFVAILIVNIVAPLLDKIFAPHPIGVRRRL